MQTILILSEENQVRSEIHRAKSDGGLTMRGVCQGTGDMFERLKKVFYGEPAEDTVPVANESEQSQENEEQTSSLPWALRVQCFIGCFFLSLLCSALGSVMLFSHKIIGFAVMISVGNIISICGTFFLTGPVRQLKKMFEKGRFIATLVFITLIAFSLIAALFLSSPFLAFILVVGEYIAMLWYSISYIPYAR
ncbi:unnamed protein product [Enterobius vermicularis]|uniref:Vesicle transport protein n=1 Tax=Enterobius vermicularis TaxID=51028 RepID=A0A0N4V7T3_ENTVE|nr:unnamed protein product [Enterobius vermicularis]